MLIRSQDKRILINMNNVSSIEVGDNELRIFADDGETIYDLCEYSTKTKAMKVLDMIQEDYRVFESSKITSTGLAAAAFIGRCDTPENVSDGIKVLNGYAEAIRESVVFQMPEDGSVEV